MGTPQQTPPENYTVVSLLNCRRTVVHLCPLQRNIPGNPAQSSQPDFQHLSVDFNQKVLKPWQNHGVAKTLV